VRGPFLVILVRISRELIHAILDFPSVQTFLQIVEGKFLKTIASNGRKTLHEEAVRITDG